MKKVLAIVAIAGFLTACNNNGEGNGGSKDSTTQTMSSDSSKMMSTDSSKMMSTDSSSKMMSTDSTKK